jgi:hypothetical protein
VNDGEGRSSFWSAWRLLNWEAAPSALSAGTERLRSKSSASSATRLRNGIEYDANGRSLGRLPAFINLP